MSASALSDLRSWLLSHGTALHPSLSFQYDETFGLSAVSTDAIPAEERIIGLPFELAVTPDLARRALRELLGKESEGAEEKDLLASYLVMHWMWEDQVSKDSSLEWPSSLQHRIYVASLPPPGDLRTPLFFSPAEKELLRGTSVQGAAVSQEERWRKDHADVAARWGMSDSAGFSWERWLVASTYLSSRAFPSRLLDLHSVASPVDASSATAPSHPVLLPGIDILNHLPLHPVSWISSPSPFNAPSSSASSGVISVHLHQPVAPSSQIHNNYGAKPNDELLLSYGFTLSSLPFDTFPLLLGGLPSSKVALCRELELDPTKRFLLNRTGLLDEDLKECVRVAMADSEEEGLLRAKGGERGRVSWENEMGSLDLLLEMVRKKLEVLQEVQAESDTVDSGEGAVRKDVRETCRIYRVGQIEILEAAVEKLEEDMELLEEEEDTM